MATGNARIRKSHLDNAIVLALGFIAACLSAGAEELTDIRNITTLTQYGPGTVFTGTGGFRVKDGGTLRFKDGGTYENTFSGGVVVEAGGSLQSYNYNAKGTPFGTGPIEIQCTGEKPCDVVFGNFDVPQTVTTTGDSTATYPAFRTAYHTCTLHGVVVGGNLYMAAGYADAKDGTMNNVVFDFADGLNAGAYDVGASVHAMIRFQSALTCGRLIGYYGVGTAASTLNGRLGGFVLSAANNNIGAIILDGQFVKCAVSGALNGASLRFEGQHSCIGPAGYTQYETGILVLNSKTSGAYTQTLKWIESDSRGRDVEAGYGIRNSSSSAATLVISGEANKTATAYVNLNGKVNLELSSAAPSTFRQVFMDRESTMNGTVAVNGGTLEVGGEATFASVPSMTVANGAVVVSSSRAAFTGLTALTVSGAGTVTVATGAASPFTDFVVDVSLGADSRLVIPSGMALNVRSLTVDGVLQPAGGYSNADFPQISGGTVESAQGSAIVEQAITWTAADATDPADSRKGTNWGLVEDPVFSSYKYLPSFAQAGTSAAFYGRNRFASLVFSAAGGMNAFALTKGSVDADFQLAGGVTASGIAKYSVEPPVTFTAASSVSVGKDSTVRFDGGISSMFDISKTGAGRVELAGENSLNATVTVSAGTLMLSGDVGGSGCIVHNPKSEAFLSLSNATVGVGLTQTGGGTDMGKGINVPAGTESTVNGYAEFNGSISFHGGGTAILAGGARIVNKCYSYDGTVVVSNMPTTSSFSGSLGGLQAYSNGKWVFKVAGNRFAAAGVDSALVARSGDFDLRCDNIAADPQTVWWSIGSGTFELNGTHQTAKCILNGSSGGKFLTTGSLHGDVGSQLTLSGDTEARIYLGSITGGLSLSYAGGEGGSLTLAERDFTSTGSVEVVSGTLAFSNATWKAASEVYLTGGTLRVVSRDSFGRNSAVLYVKDGVMDLGSGTSNRFKEAYFWNSTNSRYERVPDGVYSAGAEGFSAHFTGGGEIRVGKVGTMIILL